MGLTASFFCAIIILFQKQLLGWVSVKLFNTARVLRQEPVAGAIPPAKSLLRDTVAEAHQPEGYYYTFTPLTVANEAALLFKAGFAEVQVRWAKSNTAVLLATK